ncbi:MAG: hypothetical protein HZC17_05985 [Candidatus Omnitrophica bacterium]|nr:hypothetical protein [Candidatus Omnitrophota bacterium]
MTAYKFYELNQKVLDQMDLPRLPFPVRTEKEQRIFGGQQVQFDLLLDELEEYLRKNPQERDRYRQFAGRLAHFEGVRLGQNGFPELAAHYLETGLSLNPEDLALRFNYALSLQSLGKKEDAMKQYRIIIEDPAARVNPLVWIFAARLSAELGNPKTAYYLLEAVADCMPEDNEFWELLYEMKERAGFVDRPKPKFCGACGKPLVVGTKFCGGCGRKI